MDLRNDLNSELLYEKSTPAGVSSERVSEIDVLTSLRPANIEMWVLVTWEIARHTRALGPGGPSNLVLRGRQEYRFQAAG